MQIFHTRIIKLISFLARYYACTIKQIDGICRRLLLTRGLTNVRKCQLAITKFIFVRNNEYIH